MRIPVPESLEDVNDDDDPNHFNWAGFELGALEALPTERGGVPQDWQMDRRMRVAQEFQKRGVTRFLGSLWSPPDFLKTHRSRIQGGHPRMDRLDEFAEYWAAFVKIAKKNYGIDIGAITVQNELLFIQFYDSCVYTPEVLREAVRAVGRRFDREGIRTKIMIPEDMMFPGRMMAYIRPTMADDETRRYVGGFATHRQEGFAGVRSWYEQTKHFGLQTWMTETSGHPSDWAGSMRMASDMYDYLVGGNVSAWIYWQLGWIASSTNPGPSYHATRHYFRFIRPGAWRIDSSSSDPNLLVSAYRHDVDGTITLVLLNNSDQAGALRINISGGSLPESYEVIQSVEGSYSVKMPDVSGSVLNLNMPPRSMITMQGISEGLKTRESIDQWPTAVNVPDDTEIWGNHELLDAGIGFDISRAAEMNDVNWLNLRINDGHLNAQRRNGWTALHIGILAGSAQAVDRLIEAGADVNLPANDGWTPLHMAAAAFPPDNGNKRTPPNATQREIFMKVLNAGANVHAVTTDGWSVLHAGVANAHTPWRGDPEDKFGRIRAILQAGADVNAADINGRTPLHWAAWQGYTNLMTQTDEVVKILLEAGADHSRRDNLGRTPLHYAAEMGHHAIVGALMSAGADNQLADVSGNTPISLAENRGLVVALAALRGEEVPATVVPPVVRKPFGRELYLAARAGDVQRVRQLIEQGADMHYMDSDGFRGVDRARDHGHSEVVRIWEAAAEQ